VRPATDADRDDLTERATRFLGQVATGWFWDRWLAVYDDDRVIVEVTAERILWWPSGDTLEDAEVLGAALPEAEVGRSHRQEIRARRGCRWRRW
jgi:hypothetical protein